MVFNFGEGKHAKETKVRGDWAKRAFAHSMKFLGESLKFVRYTKRKSSKFVDFVEWGIE